MKSSLKFFRLGAITVLLIFSSSFLAGSLKKPSPPSWDSQWLLPLVNRSHSVLDLIEEIDQEGLSLDSLGNPEIYLEENKDAKGLGVSLSNSMNF